MDENMKAAGAVLFADAGRNGGEIFLTAITEIFPYLLRQNRKNP